MKKKQSKRIPIWVLLICLQTNVNALSLFPWNGHPSSGNPINTMKCTHVSPPGVCCLYSTPVDDDDISQHEAMMVDPKEDDSTRSKASKKKVGGYRRIEDWHEETVSKNPKHVLTRLQQEKAMWEKKFEDLSGDGI